MITARLKKLCFKDIRLSPDVDVRAAMRVLELTGIVALVKVVLTKVIYF